MMTEQSATTPRQRDMMIKVCGMRDADNIRLAASLTPMLMGFIFYEKSPRCAEGLDPRVVAELPSYVRPVAVFVNAPIERVVEVSGRYGIKIAQLHGDESPAYCAELRRRGLTVFKAIAVETAADVAAAAEYDGSVDLFVFDTHAAATSDGPASGGTGRKFPWEALDDYKLATPYLLSGGIGPDDVERVVKAVRPGMAGIDVNSRFETSPGVKDVMLLAKFITQLRLYNEDEPIAKPFWEKTE